MVGVCRVVGTQVRGRTQQVDGDMMEEKRRREKKNGEELKNPNHTSKYLGTCLVAILKTLQGRGRRQVKNRSIYGAGAAGTWRAPLPRCNGGYICLSAHCTLMLELVLFGRIAQFKGLVPLSAMVGICI